MNYSLNANMPTLYQKFRENQTPINTSLLCKQQIKFLGVHVYMAQNSVEQMDRNSIITSSRTIQVEARSL